MILWPSTCLPIINQDLVDKPPVGYGLQKKIQLTKLKLSLYKKNNFIVNTSWIGHSKFGDHKTTNKLNPLKKDLLSKCTLWSLVSKCTKLLLENSKFSLKDGLMSKPPLKMLMVKMLKKIPWLLPLNTVQLLMVPPTNGVNLLLISNLLLPLVHLLEPPLPLLLNLLLPVLPKWILPIMLD